MNLRNWIENTDESRVRSGWRILLFATLIAIGRLLLAFAGISGWALFGGLLLVTLIAGFIAASALDRRPFSGYGILPDRLWRREALFGFLLASVVSLFFFAAGWITGVYNFLGFGWDSGSLSYFFQMAATYLFVMFCVAWYEEFQFRGYLTLNLFEGLHDGSPGSAARSGALAVGLVSVVFALMHANNPNAGIFGILNIILAGGLLGYAYLVTGRLGLPFGIHFGWNYVQGPLLGLPVSGLRFRKSALRIEDAGQEWITGGAFGLEGGLMGTLALILITFICFLWARRKHGASWVHPAILSQVPAIRAWHRV